MLAGGRTVVSAMPRSSKLKVSGGTQTDFQQSKFNTICQRRAVINDFHVISSFCAEQMQQNPQYRSFSLTGANAAQLSQSVKERFGSHSLPKGGLDMHVFQQRFALQ